MKHSNKFHAHKFLSRTPPLPWENSCFTWLLQRLVPSPGAPSPFRASPVPLAQQGRPSQSSGSGYHHPTQFKSGRASSPLPSASPSNHLPQFPDPDFVQLEKLQAKSRSLSRSKSVSSTRVQSAVESCLAGASAIRPSRLGSRFPPLGLRGGGGPVPSSRERVVLSESASLPVRQGKGVARRGVL